MQISFNLDRVVLCPLLLEVLMNELFGVIFLHNHPQCILKLSIEGDRDLRSVKSIDLSEQLIPKVKGQNHVELPLYLSQIFPF